LVKLHDALRKIIREHGTAVLGEKRLVFLLMDFRAFDDCPAMRRVMLAAAQNGSLKDLSGLAPLGDVDSADYLRSADDLKRTLSSEFQFRPDLASCAVDSLSYALGIIREVREPPYHGFDPFDACRCGRKHDASCDEGSAAGNSSDAGEQGAASEGPVGGTNENSGAAPESGDAASLRAAAERGDAEAEYRLGEGYAGGDGVQKDETEAFGWFLKAAGQGHREAQFRLGEMCHFGEGCGRDDAAAVSWWRKAAEQGHAGAECRLGDACRYGDGTEQDDAEAERWYRLAARHGSSEAQTVLSDAYSGDVRASGGGEEDFPVDGGESLLPGMAFAASGTAILGAVIGFSAGAIVVPYAKSFRDSIDWAFWGVISGALIGALLYLVRFLAARLRRGRRRK